MALWQKTVAPFSEHKGGVGPFLKIPRSNSDVKNYASALYRAQNIRDPLFGWIFFFTFLALMGATERPSYTGFRGLSVRGIMCPSVVKLFVKHYAPNLMPYPKRQWSVQTNIDQESVSLPIITNEISKP